MRKLFICLLLTSVLHSFAAFADSDARPKVFMFVPDGSRDLGLMLTEEVGVMRSMLEQAGYDIDIATSDGNSMIADTVTLKPTIKLADVDIEQYAGVVLPCMAPAPGSESTPSVVRELVERAISLDRPVAAARGSVVTLAKAGGLSGREYAFASAVDVQNRPEFDGGMFVGIGVANDSGISTSGICPLAARSLGEPDGTVELTENFIKNLSEST